MSREQIADAIRQHAEDATAELRREKDRFEKGFNEIAQKYEDLLVQLGAPV